MELQQGQTVWLAWTLVEAMAYRVAANVTEAVVENVEARLVRTSTGTLRQIAFYEKAFSTEAEARSANAAELERMADRVATAARDERLRAAQVAARAQVAYV